MRTAILAALLAVLPAWSRQAQDATPPVQEKTAPPKPEEQSPPKPAQQQKPVSLSPVMPVDAPNPAVMAEAPGKKQGGAPVGDAYIIGPEDVLGVRVWENPSFNGNYNVLPDGTISIPLLGPIRAAGLTPLQLEDAINETALKFLNVAHTAVQVEAVKSKKIYFDGEGIASPGEMPYMLPLHLFEAISARGGFKDFADKRHIKVQRDGKILVTVSYNDLVNGKRPEKNILLKPNDHVIVK
ncbi:MAG: polysaccharide biosynthesis/export family protein [Bryobacteraceae bacterium]|jgi:polysaccharide export outer membrane protein